MIAWEESGSGPPIVLVHGNTENRRGWDPVVALLADRFRCVRLDLRGHGESSDADDYSAVAMAADVATVVDEAGITAEDPPLLVGHSLGAVVVTAYAAGGVPVRGVVNIDQPLALSGFKAALEPIAPMLRGDGFHEALGIVFESLGVDALPPAWRAWADACHAAARQEVVMGIWDTVLDADVEALDALVSSMLGAITAPYLAIHGSDPGAEYVSWLTSSLPSATVEVWDGDGHYPHLAEPERFAARIAAL